MVKRWPRLRADRKSGTVTGRRSLPATKPLPLVGGAFTRADIGYSHLNAVESGPGGDFANLWASLHDRLIHYRQGGFRSTAIRSPGATPRLRWSGVHSPAAALESLGPPAPNLPSFQGSTETPIRLENDTALPP